MSMDSKLYRYVSANVHELDFIFIKPHPDKTIQRLATAYKKTQHYKSWLFQLRAYSTLSTFSKSFLDWSYQATPTDLEPEFNGHEIMELMIEDED